MMKKILKANLFLYFCMLFSNAKAQEKILNINDSNALNQQKLITNARSFAIGNIELLDTYLSNQKYRGTELRFISHTTRETSHYNWSTNIMHQAAIARTLNKQDTGSELYAVYNIEWGKLHKWTFLDNNLIIRGGGLIDSSLGVIYNTRNSNNPAQALADFNIGPIVSCTYRFRFLRKHPMAVNYQAFSPLIGLMFCPNYSQSYYEAFTQGNYDHNMVFTHPINKPSLRQMLSLDFMLFKTQVRIGYVGNYLQWNVNNIKSHTYSHAFSIGIVKHFKFISLQP